jgi:uncharacterized protein (TIGR03435 family)
MRQMLRQMLEDRFALRVHHEIRDMPVYELLVARSDGRLGPNLKPAQIDYRPFLTGQRPMSEAPVLKREDGSFPRCARVITLTMQGFHPWMNGAPVSELLRLIEGTVKRTVIDKTGLSGVFDIDLTYITPDMPGARGKDNAIDGPSLMTALSEQLGLRLESADGPVEVVVIDAASPPTQN